jgi:opacity protein-like surface antigen
MSACFCVIALAAQAQTSIGLDDLGFRFGVKLGVQTLDSFHTVPGFNADDSRLVAGGLADVRINDYFGAEFNILYRRFRFDALVPAASVADTVLSTTRAHALDFPLLFKWRPLGHPDVAPFVSSGLALRYINGNEKLTYFTGRDREQDFSDSLAQESSFNAGWVLAGGADFNRSGGVRITPELRYTRWGRENFRALSATVPAEVFRSRKNQFEVLIGITF